MDSQRPPSQEADHSNMESNNDHNSPIKVDVAAIDIEHNTNLEYQLSIEKPFNVWSDLNIDSSINIEGDNNIQDDNNIQGDNDIRGDDNLEGNTDSQIDTSNRPPPGWPHNLPTREALDYLEQALTEDKPKPDWHGDDVVQLDSDGRYVWSWGASTPEAMVPQARVTERGGPGTGGGQVLARYVPPKIFSLPADNRSGQPNDATNVRFP
ncbi:hypothetical protein SLS53_004302 [Cytospora paraplurivora]|uniref:Uncharacterized protein n=1 Tax=Cytospora paraplurivora TaxID=2898453 RepID=A0AAN9UAS7_9PEZI